MSTRHQIYIGDSRHMDAVADESVHLIVTSPPYWQLKDYGGSAQIGFDDSYEDYINNLNVVWLECFRVLHPGCRLVVNIGDQFARSVYYGRYKVIPIRTEIIKFCETIGLDYMGAIIWHKVTTTNTTGGASIMGSFPYPRNGILKIDYEFILIFKKQGKSPEVTPEQKEQSKMTTEEWNTYFAGHWNFPGDKQGKHLAMFPEELPRRLIRMFTFVGETVLDPFLGSGTTSLAAQKLDRHSIGYEINPDYLPFIKEKLAVTQDDLFSSTASIQIEQQQAGAFDAVARRDKLPYLFVDTVRMDKKIDPRQSNFGSKINHKSTEREQYFKVKKILSPVEFILNTGQKITLLGIKPIPEKTAAALDYLKAKIKGKVFLKVDKNINENGDFLPCYLYLANKTFINAHLVRDGYAEADPAFDLRKTKNRAPYRPAQQDGQTGGAE